MYKGIVLAGGNGTRLYPATKAVSKQLMVVYDKPMIYYPIATLMLAGITEILVITTENDQPAYQALLRDGSQWGLKFSYIVQPRPEGLAQAFTLGREFLDGAPAALTLGDNLFFGHAFTNLLRQATSREDLATVFLYQVSDPGRYGVAEFDEQGDICQVVEKPKEPPSRWAVTGLYFFTPEVSEVAAGVQKSARGEYEITEVINHYIKSQRIQAIKMGRGYAWLDTGTPEALLQASSFVGTIESRQGVKIACLEEIAYNLELMGRDQLKQMLEDKRDIPYYKYVLDLIEAGGPVPPA
ncbi:glucose-1-phosphate thymidylyltransferase RfbA [Desulfoferula mesophila]|uniref:Glucose-1-phosphate thymidylyltransferase n=1 Tax=Desulfoferula mesophila TaxID=3058419 RepID=A0AAU9EL48_9BACT|nr:glucose-1-phosphate thymidylyltransferase [Desulfoferula mesophilus]